MCQVRKVKSSELFPVIKEILSEGRTAWITVTGNSMYPFLREDIDSVKLSAASLETIKKGDIVLIRRLTGEYILHRVIRKEDDCFYMVGDAQRWIEGPLNPDQLIAVVTEIKRENRQFTCSNLLWRFLVGIWIKILPFRNYFIKAIRVFSKLKGRITSVQMT